MQVIHIPSICCDGLDFKDSVSVDDPFEKFMETKTLLEREHGSQPSKKVRLSSPVSE